MKRVFATVTWVVTRPRETAHPDPLRDAYHEPEQEHGQPEQHDVAGTEQLELEVGADEREQHRLEPDPRALEHLGYRLLLVNVAAVDGHRLVVPVPVGGPFTPAGGRHECGYDARQRPGTGIATLSAGGDRQKPTGA